MPNPTLISKNLLNSLNSLIHLATANPYKIMLFMLLLSVAWKSANEERTRKRSPDEEHDAYRRPSVKFFPDTEFNKTRDLEAWTTDRHASGVLYKAEYYQLRTSFDLEGFPDELKEGLIQTRQERDYYCFNRDVFAGCTNPLSHRAIDNNLQSTFGFFGHPTIETLFRDFGSFDSGYIVGFRGISKPVKSKGYELVKVNLDEIDFTVINRGQYNNGIERIAHLYIKNDRVQIAPDTQELRGSSCKLTPYQDPKSKKFVWPELCYEEYLESLPNFASMVDWVVDIRDFENAIKGKPTNNLLTNQPINIRTWQKEEIEKAKLPLERHGFFTLERPKDYPRSGPSLHFKVGR